MVEIDAHGIAWVKSTFSSTGECVEVAESSGRIMVRCSRDRGGRRMMCSASAWSRLLSWLTTGD